MKILLIYFTGTYNTLYLTTILKNMLEKENHKVDTLVLNENSKITNQYDFVGIGYPIHAFNVPKNFINNLKKLNLKDCNYFIYKNSGEVMSFNNASSYGIYKLLKKNNNQLFGEYHYVMPYNILFQTKKEFVSYAMSYNYKYLRYLSVNFMNKKEYKISLWNRFISFVFKIEHLGAKINSKHFKVDENKCIRCKKCMTNCPTHNISFNKSKKKKVFSDKCILCMRCAFCCPTNAISIGLLNKYKVNGRYDFMTSYKYNFKNEQDKFYKRFKTYFEMIDELTCMKD